MGNKRSANISNKIALTAGALAAATPIAASADVVVVDGSPIFQSAFDGQGSTTDWDVDGDGTAEFQFWVRSSSFFSSFYSTFQRNFYGIVNFASQGYFGTTLNGRGLVGDGFGRANALNNGFSVGPTLSGYQWGGDGDIRYRSAVRFDSSSFSSYYGFGSSSDSAIGVDFIGFGEGANLLGFRFDIDGNLHYGWAEVEIDGDLISINRWAYESDPNTGLSIGTIPEPSSLATLAMGAAGLLIRRRRPSGNDA